MALLCMPFSNPSTYPGHSGIDFPQARGTAIRASGPGVVKRLSHSAAGGYWTVMDYDGVSSLIGYAHQDRQVTVVRAGQRVVSGQIIGYVGSRGTNSTGPHLHMERIGHATYAAMMALLNRNCVVGGGTPSGGGSVSDNWPARKLYGEAWVKEAQRDLAYLGLYSGDGDGKDGPKTQAATVVLQKAGGLKADGVFGPDTKALAKLILAGKNNTARSDADIQRLVGVVVDDIWGGRTSFGVYVWQRKSGLTADAIWGPASDAKGFPAKPTVPTVPEKPTLPARVARDVTYPESIRAWTPPYAYRISDGKPNVRPGGKVTGVALHHTGSVNDQESFFTSANDRVSCPNLYVNERAELVELIPFHMQPSSTGGANDWTIAIEVENQTGTPEWGISDAQREAVSQFLAWLSQQTTLGGIPVNVPLDRKVILGHNEFPTTTNGTICPGPSMHADDIVKRAIEVVNPTVEMVQVPRDELEQMHAAMEGWLS